MARARYKVGTRFFRHRYDALDFSKNGNKHHVRAYDTVNGFVYVGGTDPLKPGGDVMSRATVDGVRTWVPYKAGG